MVRVSDSSSSVAREYFAFFSTSDLFQAALITVIFMKLDNFALFSALAFLFESFFDDSVVYR